MIALLSALLTLIREGRFPSPLDDQFKEQFL